MTEPLKKILDNFDRDTVEYLDMNKGEIFKSLSTGTPLPVLILETLATTHTKRQVIVEAIDKLDNITRQ
jgi:hypothetical protein